MLCFCLLVCCSFSLHVCLCTMYSQCWWRPEDNIRSTHELQMFVSCHFSTKIWIWKPSSALNCWTSLSSSCLRCSPCHSIQTIPVRFHLWLANLLSLFLSLCSYTESCALCSLCFDLFFDPGSHYITFNSQRFTCLWLQTAEIKGSLHFSFLSCFWVFRKWL